jgi:hypothetical protein
MEDVKNFLLLLHNGVTFVSTSDKGINWIGIKIKDYHRYIVLSKPSKRDDLIISNKLTKYETRVETLREVLTDKNFKGYKVFTAMEAYERYLELLQMFWNKFTPSIVLKQSPPNASLELLIKWFNNNYAHALREFNQKSLNVFENSNAQFRFHFIKALIEKRKVEFENHKDLVEAEINKRFIGYLENQRNMSSEAAIIAKPYIIHETLEDYKKEFENEYLLLSNEAAKGKCIEKYIKSMQAFIIEYEQSIQHLDKEREAHLFEVAILFKKYLEELLPKSANGANIDKIKWLGSPEQFGYIFGQFASLGYIELPTKHGEGTFSKLAQICLQVFEINTTKGKNKNKPTTTENLERALNPESNNLSGKGKANLKLPPIKDLL